VCVCGCIDGSCVRADGTSWSMILNDTGNSTLMSESDDVADTGVSNVTSLSHDSAADTSSLHTSSSVVSHPSTAARSTTSKCHLPQPSLNIRNQQRKDFQNTSTKEVKTKCILSLESYLYLVSCNQF